MRGVQDAIRGETYVNDPRPGETGPGS